MQDKIITVDNKFACVECKNEVETDSTLQVGDIVECPFCGLEYEVVEKDGEENVLQVIEEEK